MTNVKKIKRREFLGSATAASLAFTIIPRQILGGSGYVAPSDKLTLGYIGCGTQGLSELASLLPNPAVQIVAVCDPNKYSTNYVDWNHDRVRNNIRKVLGDESWGEYIQGIPGGRDVGQELVQKYYGKFTASGTYKGCASYEDFRELLTKESDLDAIKNMTPDHLHAAVALASLKNGKPVVTHKPIANRMYEAKLTIDMARKTGLSTHFLAWSEQPGCDLAKKWINEGFIGKLREIHNWTNRPFWPQWSANPTDNPPIPKDFNWDLWLGPVPNRPYHPNYTHHCFRGWYDFGAGAIGDMAHYSLFPLFLKFGITTPPTSADPYSTTTCAVDNNVTGRVKNTVGFPLSNTIRFGFQAQSGLPQFDLFWYDGGMKPPIPSELMAEGKSLDPEGMMFIGDKGKILAGFRCENPILIPANKKAHNEEKSKIGGSDDPNDVWINAFKNNTQTLGSFINAQCVTETILLGGVALRAGKKVEYDSAKMSINNNIEANKYLIREEYREGWEL